MRVVRSGVIFAQQGPRPSSAAGADEANLMREGETNKTKIKCRGLEYNQGNQETHAQEESQKEHRRSFYINS